jgi:hypothetical protein
MIQETIGQITYRLLADGSVDIEHDSHRTQLAPNVLYGLSILLQRREVRKILRDAKHERRCNDDA